MRRLSLRARILFAVGIIALVQIVSAVVVISVASDRLIDQVDDRLEAATEAASSGSAATELAPLPGLSDVYQGVFTDDELQTLNAVVDRRNKEPAPEVSAATIRSSRDGPITVEAQRGPGEYRLVAVDVDDQVLVLASPLEGYEFTINRLVQVIAIATVALLLVLAAVTWWVLRLGIRPIKQMTASAEAIAGGALSERIEADNTASEAGQLATALNTMMVQIESSFDERARSEERLRQFVADASHELRTPVATIRGYAELHQAGGLDNGDDLDDAMRRTLQESERMSRLIADMLRLAKLDREPDLDLDTVDLSTIARDTVSDAAAAHTGRTIELVADSPVEVLGDEDLLRQALANLVGNALVHTGGDAATTVSVARTDDVATVTVHDDGGGMPAEVVSRATERFFRADAARSRHRGGSGLGLSIVASVVEAHDGELVLRSAPGRGTAVTITVPIASPSDDTQLAPSSLSAGSELGRAYSNRAIDDARRDPAPALPDD